MVVSKQLDPFAPIKNQPGVKLIFIKACRKEMPLTAALVGNGHVVRLSQLMAAMRRRARWGRWKKEGGDDPQVWICQFLEHPYHKWGLKITSAGKFGPNTEEILSAVKEAGQEPLPEYPSEGTYLHSPHTFLSSV